MFEALSDRLNDIFTGLRGKGTLTERDVDTAMREIRLSLLEADVNFKVVKEFVARVKERCIGVRGDGEPDAGATGGQDRPRRAAGDPGRVRSAGTFEHAALDYLAGRPARLR